MFLAACTRSWPSCWTCIENDFFFLLSYPRRSVKTKSKGKCNMWSKLLSHNSTVIVLTRTETNFSLVQALTLWRAFSHIQLQVVIARGTNRLRLRLSIWYHVECLQHTYIQVQAHKKTESGDITKQKNCTLVLSGFKIAVIENKQKCLLFFSSVEDLIPGP